MATRIVERKLEWCEDRAEESLLKSGYQVECSKGKEWTIWGKYVGADKQRMLLRPRIEVGLTPISNRVTRVRVWFKLHVWVVIVVGFSWLLVGFVPFLIMLKVTAQGSELHSLWIVLGWVATAVWMLYFLIKRFTLGVKAFDGHLMKTEEQLWQHLDPKDSYSHEIRSASQTWLMIFAFCKGASFCMVILGVGFLVGGGSHSANVGGYIPLIGGALLFAVMGWMACSYELPHRFHWKVRFYLAYLCWWVVVSAPCMMILCYGMDSASSSGVPFRDAAVVIVFCLQALTLQAVLRMLPQFRNEEKAKFFYSPPSTRYETLSEQNVAKNIRWLLKKHRLWTWATFLLFTILFYAAALYLVIVLVETTAGIAGAKWAFARSWYWPLLVNLEGRLAAIQAFLLTCIVSSPMLFSVAQEIQAYRKSQRTLALAEKLGLALADAHLPPRLLVCMRDKLKTDRIFVVEVPDPLVNVKLAKRGFLRKSYLLEVSVGARETLEEAEMEALLWHECGHAELIGHTLWRDIAAVLAPWGPRFLDLLEDFYENERDSDLSAVQSMGNTRPLKSALRKISDQYKNLPEKGKRQERGIYKLRDGFDFLKPIWNLDWVGYLHPNIDQRLRWVEEWEAQGAIGSC